MKTLRGTWVALIGAWMVIATPTGLATGYELDTHRELSSFAFDLSRISTTTLQTAYGIRADDRFPGRRLSFASGRHTAAEWVREGGADEDWPAFRVLAHFYDPIRNVGLTPPFPQGPSGPPTPDWALEDTGWFPLQQHSYRDARDAFYTGLTASSRDTRDRELGHTFYSLGHVIHLIQDMAQPQHTRNDGHPPHTHLASFLERYVDRNIPAFSRAIETALQSGVQPPRPAYPRDLWVNAAGTGFAQFSNRNFVSAGTNFTALRTGATAERYPSPVLNLEDSRTSMPEDRCKDGTPPPNLLGIPLSLLTFFGNRFNDPVTGAQLHNPRMTTHSMFDQLLENRGYPRIFALNCFNLDTAADLLLPRAVAHSAALLQYFFRGSIGSEWTSSSPNTLRLKNNTAEPMNGRFELYYDDSAGTRRPVGSWPVALTAQGFSDVAVAPLSQGQATRCMLVYRGALGAETDAVAGQLVNCPVVASNPTPPPPPPPPPPTTHQWWSVYGYDGGPIPVELVEPCGGRILYAMEPPTCPELAGLPPPIPGTPFGNPAYDPLTVPDTVDYLGARWQHAGFVYDRDYFRHCPVVGTLTCTCPIGAFTSTNE